jgi:hypothetical protein
MWPHEPKLLSNVPRHQFLSIASVAWTMFGVARVISKPRDSSHLEATISSAARC